VPDRAAQKNRLAEECGGLCCWCKGKRGRPDVKLAQQPIQDLDDPEPVRGGGGGGGGGWEVGGMGGGGQKKTGGGGKEARKPKSVVGWWGGGGGGGGRCGSKCIYQKLLSTTLQGGKGKK